MFGIGDKLMDILGDVFTWFYEALIEPFLILHSLHNLIFGEGRTEDLVYNTFNSNELTNIYGPGSTLVATIAGFFILASLIMAGMRMSSVAINPGSRTYYLEYLKDLAIVVVLFFNLDFLYDLIFTLNSGIVDIFAANTGGMILEFGETVEGAGIIGAIIINIIVLFLTLWANWYYMMRKLTLLILMVLGPLMLAMYLIPQLKSITGAWFKELTGTIFVQSIHAVLLWVTMLITAGSDPITSGEFKVTDALLNIDTVILYLIFIPTGEAIRSLLGMGGGMSSGLSKAGAMFGMSALAGMYGSVKGALDKDNGSVVGALRGVKDGVKNTSGKSGEGEESIIKDAAMAANTGTNSGTTPNADGMLKWGDIGSRGGKAILGAAGSVGGAAIGGPMGAMTGATGGFIAGGIAGGLTGRTAKGLKDLAGKNLENGKNAFNKTWGEMADPVAANQEDIANKIADKETADYENENKDSFINKASERFPELDKQGLEMAWNDHKKDIHAGNLSNARELVKKSFNNDGKLANADVLASQSAEEMTDKWANDNKDEFSKNYDLNNPLPSNASKDEQMAHANGKAKAWSNTVASKRSDFQSIADDTARDMKAAAMGNSNIDRADFARNLSENMKKHDNDAFVGEYLNQNPHATLNEANEAFNSAKRNLAKDNFAKNYVENNPGSSMDEAKQTFDSIQGSSSKKDYVNKAIDTARANHNMMAEKAYDTGKDFVEDGNKEGFIKNYQSNINPSATEDQASQIYDSLKANPSKQAFMKEQRFTPTESLTNNASAAYDMAKNHANSGANKDSFVQAYKASHPNATTEQAEHLFDKANNMVEGGNRSYYSTAKNAVQGVQTASILNKGANKEVNRGYLANQLASAKTIDDKQHFIKDKMSAGMNEVQAKEMWGNQETKQFQDNLSHFNNQLPQTLPMKQIVRSSNGVQKLSAVAAASSAFVGNASGVTPVMNTVGNAISKGKMVTESFVDGYSEGSQTLDSPGQSSSFVTKTKAVGSGLARGIQSSKATLKPSPEGAAEKLEGFRNTVAYTGGLVGGTKMYQKAANFASRVNPYNKAIDSSSDSGVYEASEIKQMAARTNPATGGTYVPSGNIKLVSTPTQSFIQAIDTAGNNRIVSKYGSGDSALKQGQVVYQDLNIDENGGFSPASSPYKLDTGGQKIDTGRAINVNPNKLISTQRTPSINTRVTQDVAPFNANVENGSFSKNDAIEATENIRTVVTKSRSYMVGNDKETGREVRLSSYKPGDARLEANDVREIKYEVRNKRFRVDNVKNANGKEVSYSPTLEVEEYLYAPQNQRAKRRAQFERDRFRKIGGAE